MDQKARAVSCKENKNGGVVTSCADLREQLEVNLDEVMYKLEVRRNVHVENVNKETYNKPLCRVSPFLPSTKGK